MSLGPLWLGHYLSNALIETGYDVLFKIDDFSHPPLYLNLSLFYPPYLSLASPNAVRLIPKAAIVYHTISVINIVWHPINFQCHFLSDAVHEFIIRRGIWPLGM